MRCLVATLGFDADFVLRKLAAESYERVACLGLEVEQQAWSRVEKTFSLIGYYCNTLRMRCELTKVVRENIVGRLKEILEELVNSCDSLTLYLTGGPRIVVVSAFLASLLLSPPLAAKITVEVEGENFEARLRVPLKAFSDLFRLNELERSIVIEALRGSVRPAELPEKLKISKATAYRKVKDLWRRGILERSGSGVEEYVVSEVFRRAIETVGQ